MQIMYIDSTDKTRYFNISIYRNTQRLYADSENYDLITPLKIGEFSAEMVKKDSIISITWIDSHTGFTYLLTSSLDENEAIKIAENISSN